MNTNTNFISNRTCPLSVPSFKRRYFKADGTLTDIHPLDGVKADAFTLENKLKTNSIGNGVNPQLDTRRAGLSDYVAEQLPDKLKK